MSVPILHYLQMASLRQLLRDFWLVGVSFISFLHFLKSLRKYLKRIFRLTLTHHFQTSLTPWKLKTEKNLARQSVGRYQNWFSLQDLYLLPTNFTLNTDRITELVKARCNVQGDVSLVEQNSFSFAEVRIIRSNHTHSKVKLCPVLGG